MTFNYTVPNGKNHAPIRLYAVQGEAGARTFRLSLGVGQTNTSQTFVYVAKNDGTVCVINAMYNGDVVTFTLPLQACTCPGLQKVYIQFLGTEVDLRWNNLELWVQPCDIENAVASTDDLGPLANIITDPDYLEQIESAYTTATSQLEALMDAFTPKGEYNPETAYQKFNVVTSGGSSYVALQPTTGNAPPNPAYWQLLAAAGEQGKQGVQGPPGEKGSTGEPGQAATIQVGSVTTGAAGSQASVVNSGTSAAAVLNFTIPQGETGPQGIQGEQGLPGPGLEIAGGPYATPEEVPSPENGSCYLVGAAAPYDVYYRNNGQWTNLGPIQGAEGPQGAQGDPGQAATIQVGQVATGEPGSQAAVTNSGTENAAVLNFTIPQGAVGQTGPVGATPNLTIGTVSTLEPEEQATASITGTAENPVLNLGIPQGKQGSAGQAGLTAEQVIALIYPVGAIMPSTVNVNPGTYLTGTTWELFGAGKTLVGVDTSDDDFNTVEKTGGQKEWLYTHTHDINPHTLTLSEIPNHNHGMTHTHSDTFSISALGGRHGHSYSGNTGYGGDTGSARIFGFGGAADSGALSLGSNSLTLAYPSNGGSWGYTTLSLDGNHRHSVAMTITNSGPHGHDIEGSVSTYSGNTNTTGGGGGHTHTAESRSLTTPLLQPYITCYFWKRTA